MKDRITKNEYYFAVVEAVAKRSTCDRGRAGAILVKEGRIISTGYAGAPSGLAHCDHIGHQMETRRKSDGAVSHHCVRTTHAEINAVVQAARYGAPVDGTVLYCSMFPCHDCAKMIINAGVREVKVLHDYREASDSKSIFKLAGVSFEIVNKDFLKYEEEKDVAKKEA